jgi:lipopolysaccharide assembly outer membrane protein LptD (OstA)
MLHRRAAVVQQKGADISVRGHQTRPGGPGVTILTGGVDVFAGTAHITADEAELHEAGPKVLLRGNVVVQMLDGGRQ